MNGLTVAEISASLGIPPKTVKSRLSRAGIAPIAYAGPTAIYSHDAVAAIRDTPPPGRPKKPV